jgi:DNA-binding beta-propeller fold protein YncE
LRIRTVLDHYVEFEIRIDVTTRVQMPAVVFSPTGALLYVLDQTTKLNRLLIVDAACGRIKQTIELATGTPPTAFVISPDGARAFVTNGSRIEVVNLVSGHAIGAFNLVLLTNERNIRALALSPDGAFLYAATFQFITMSVNRIRVFETARLEQELLNGVIPTAPHVSVTPQFAGQPTSESPSSLAVSPDGRSLYLVLSGGRVCVKDLGYRRPH